MIAGGLYQIDTKYGEGKKYILRTLWNCGIDLDQSDSLMDYIEWRDDLYQQYQEEIAAGLKDVLNNKDDWT